MSKMLSACKRRWLMTQGQPRGRFGRKGVVGLCLLICFVILAARLIRLRREPECFSLDEGWASPGYIHDGQKYLIVGNTIVTQPVAGGPSRAVVQEDSKYQLSGVAFADNSIVYRLVPIANFRGGVAGSIGGSRFLGTFRPALHRPTP